MKLKRYEGNPILTPIPEHEWESKVVFNCAVVYLDGKVHIVYRAGDKEDISRLGYAVSRDGFHVDERLSEPIYLPQGEVEKYGCEDPRISKVGERLYMSYTAYGETPGMATKVRKSIQIAITSISVEDFLNRQWNWTKPHYPFPGVDNKGAVFFPEKIQSKYVMYHRIPPHIWVAYSEDLRNWRDSNIVLTPQYEWEYFKIGTGGPPIKTDYGWLVIYHTVDMSKVYRLSYAITAIDDPTKIIYKHSEPIIGPEKEFETQGDVANVVYTCGAVLIDDTVFVYYGGADTVICVATARLEEFLLPLKLWRCL